MTAATILNLWHSTTTESNHYPPLQATERCDVIIIGAGFTGLSAALHLAQQGVKAVVLEAHTIGHGGSGRNVGLVNAGMWTPPDQIESVLGKTAGQRFNEALAAGPQQVFELIKQHQINCEANHNGTLHCAHNAAGWKDLQNRYQQQRARNAPVELLDQQATAKRTGSALFHGALWDARAGSIQPYAYAGGLARAARAQGAQIYERSPALAVNHAEQGWTVQTPQGRVSAPKLIQATNAFGTAGAAATPFIPLYYFQLATAPLSAELRKTILPQRDSCWDTERVLSSFRMDQQGRLIVGALGNLESFGGSIHRAWAARKLRQIFPQLGETRFEHAWSGRMALTSDNVPKVVRLGAGAIAIFGYNGRGIAPGTLFGKCAADWAIRDNEDDFPVVMQDAHQEKFIAAKAVIYEAGATLTHLLKVRGG